MSDLKVGDWVVAAHSGLGCWRTHAIYAEEDVVRIEKDLPFEAAATFQVSFASQKSNKDEEVGRGGLA